MALKTNEIVEAAGIELVSYLIEITNIASVSVPGTSRDTSKRAGRNRTSLNGGKRGCDIELVSCSAST